MKKKIVIASVLKPVNDTRMYEKMGLSLAKTDEYEVFIIGYGTDTKSAYANIRFMPLGSFLRISWRRVFIPWVILSKIHKVKPNVLIINTHDLLLVSILYKILFGGCIVYDIRENYYRNILYSNAFPHIIRTFIAVYVRIKERITIPLFHHVIVAERSYLQEMNFLGSRYTVIENKAPKPKEVPQRAVDQKNINLLFTGTIAESTGIFEAIELTNALHDIEPAVTLTIAGYCALTSTARAVHKAIANKPYIQLIGGNTLVPHPIILKEISRAHFGIIYYPPSPHTRGSTPTKLYEYMAYRLPILTWPNQHFAQKIVREQAGLMVSKPYDQLLSCLQHHRFHYRESHDLYWEENLFCSLVKAV